MNPDPSTSSGQAFRKPRKVRPAARRKSQRQNRRTRGRPFSGCCQELKFECVASSQRSSMSDTFSKSQRSQIMRSVRSTGTNAEQRACRGSPTLFSNHLGWSFSFTVASGTRTLAVRTPRLQRPTPSTGLRSSPETRDGTEEYVRRLGSWAGEPPSFGSASYVMPTQSHAAC